MTKGEAADLTVLLAVRAKIHSVEALTGMPIPVNDLGAHIHEPPSEAVRIELQKILTDNEDAIARAAMGMGQ